MIIVGYDGIFNGQILVGGEINRKRDDNKREKWEREGEFLRLDLGQVNWKKIRIECKWGMIGIIKIRFF